MKARENLKAKIAALRAKTMGAGCTEAEALAAAELAAELMQRHGLSDAELSMESATSKGASLKSVWRDLLDRAIAAATNTAIVSDHGRGFTEYTGRAPGPEIATYLRDVATRAVERELRTFKTTTWYKRRRTLKAKRAAAADFCEGMAKRLAVRILDLFRPTMSPAASREARAVVDERYAGGLVDIARPVREQRYSAAAALGAFAGESVPLNRGVGGSAAPPKAIGSG